MAVYLGIFTTSTIFSFCYSKARDKSAQIVFLVSCFMSLFIPAAVRYGIGVDYFSYMKIFKEVYYNHYRNIEYSIILICKIIQFLKLPPITLFAVYAFLTYFFLYKAVSKKDFYLCIPVYVMLLYLASLNTIREALGCTIMLLAYKHFFRKDIKKFVIYSILGVFAHKSMLIAVLLILLSSIIPAFGNNMRCALFLIIVGFFSVFARQIVFLIMNVILPYTGYASYAVNKYASALAANNTGLGFLLKMFNLFLFALLIDGVYIAKREYKASMMLVLYNAFAQSVMQIMYIFNRLVSSFTFSYIYLFLFASKSRNKYRKLIFSFIVLSYFLLFVQDINNGKIRRGQAGVFTGKNINPYLSVWTYKENEVVSAKDMRFGTFRY